ncbi:MAG: thiamine-phosphate kinase [Helicobacteraceae bacterium]|jgi:thiamine-monophosphate kinase|nr:thiamine-phosphate kinase [Helicobacteraceae bacterium]
MNEFDFINQITKSLKKQGGAIYRGVGDDSAALKIAALKGKFLLVSNDDLYENRHFLANFPPRGVGYKLIAANASDIFASGGEPKFANLSAAISPAINEGWAAELFLGALEACAEFGIEIIGGNTARAETSHFGAAILGAANRFVSRGGAKIGDDLWLTAPLGKSAIGLKALLSGDLTSEIALSHLYPKLPIKLSPLIARFASAAIDISDGFLGDAGHLIAASGVGFEARDPALIVANGADLEIALNSGEEYQILFTAPVKYRAKFEAAGAIKIGAATLEKSLAIGGKIYETKGFTHF